MFCILISVNTIYDYFDNNIIFLNSSELYNIIKSNTEYYNKFSLSDMKVRHITNINDYIKKIKSAPININNDIKDKLTYCTSIADKKLKSINHSLFIYV